MAGVYDLGLELEKLWVVNIWFNCICINVNWCCLYQIAVSIIVWMDHGYVYLYEKFKLGCTIVCQLILFVFSKLNFWRKVASSIVCFHSFIEIGKHLIWIFPSTYSCKNSTDYFKNKSNQDNMTFTQIKK